MAKVRKVGLPKGGSTGQVLTKTSGTDYDTEWAAGGGGGGSGTVTSVSVVSANGLAGTVATATTTPAITLSTSVTGILKGNGTAISAASAGTDYLTPSNIVATITNGVTTNAPSEDAVFDALALKVATSGNETIAGIKTFSSFPVTPSSAPITDYQTANKKYVDDVAIQPTVGANLFLYYNFY